MRSDARSDPPDPPVEQTPNLKRVDPPLPR
jgi:hypothetical protein